MKTKTLKSIGAVVAGLLATVILSLATDYLLGITGLMKLPFSDNPAWFVFLVILYRCIYNVAGCYIAAMLAPQNPMKHALILGTIGLAASLLGAIVMWDEETHYYPVSLIILAIPCAWLGGRLKQPKALA